MICIFAYCIWCYIEYMKRVFALLLSLLVITAGLSAQEGYYSSLDMVKGGAALKDSLYNIIRVHKQISYGSGVNSTWGAFYTTDAIDDNGKLRVADMYSDIVRYFGNKGDVVQGMNIEHSVAKSWWGGDKNNAYHDLHHLNPSDATANSRKSNYPLGKLTSVTWDNGVTFVGKAVVDGKSENAYEPCDEYKGDFARTFMYMFTCYQNLTWSYTWMNYANSTYPTLKPWAVDMLLQWHKQDPVSEKEIARNNAVYQVQGNRNPYIDYPQLADYVWGDSIDYTFNFAGKVIGGGSAGGGDKDEDEGEQGSGNFSGEHFVIVTDASKLAVGDSLIIAYDNYAMGAQNGNYRLSVDIEVADDRISSYGDDVQIVVLKKGVISGTFALYTGDGYLAAASSSSNYIATEDNLDADGSWTIDIDSSNDAVVEAQGTHTRNILQYNTSAPRFTCYKGTQKSVKIYAKSKKETTSIENPECENLAGGIYNSQGLLLPENINLKDLSPGVYIINKKKILVK